MQSLLMVVTMSTFLHKANAQFALLHTEKFEELSKSWLDMTLDEVRAS